MIPNARGGVFGIMKVRLARTIPTLAVVAATALLLLVPAGLAAAETPELVPGPSYTVWAYGVVKNVSFSGKVGLTAYQGTATYGYAVTISQTNLSATDFELFANRTMGATLSVEFCYPNCKSPTWTGTIFHHAWESVDSWANFTTAGTVVSDGQNVSAIALLNAHTAVSGSLFDTSRGLVRTSILAVNVTASAEVNFATPLGLLPTNLTSPMSWTSSAAFSASGSYALRFYYDFSGPHMNRTIGPVTFSGALSGTGNLSVAGSSQGTPVSFGGIPYTNVSLAVTGPFAVREGFILVPDEVDLFGASSSGAVGSNESGSTAVQMTSLYVNPHSRAHLGIGGSEWLYAASALDPSATAVVGGGPGGPAVSSGANPVGNTSVQGVPISPAQAQSDNSCVLSGTSCPSSSSSPRGLLPGTVLVLGAVVVVAVVGIILVAERRRIPPPAYPNANLYPPGSAAAPGPADAARSAAARRTPPASEDDPLSNLW
jgi:hypothetical protein